MLCVCLNARLRYLDKGSLRLKLGAGREIELHGRSSGHHADLQMHRLRGAWRSLTRGTIGFAESYIDGDFESEDPGALFGFFLDNKAALTAAGGGWFRARSPERRLHAQRDNSPAGARANSAAHYDLSNAFFSLWLDRSMTYSSAVFTDAAPSLEAAQLEKHNRVLALLDTRPGSTVLDIGCGWGAFPVQAVREADLRVNGITLSCQQWQYASDRIKSEGIGRQCGIHCMDYRECSGQFDHVASIEMIEAVGERYWPVYFATLNQRLKPGGTAVLQAITIDEAFFPRYRQQTDFIQRYIFPGGMLPTVSLIRRHATQNGLHVCTHEAFPESYARTIRIWRSRFRQNWGEIQRCGFDDRFRRLWDYYLNYCLSGFEKGLLSVGLYRLVKPR